MYAGVEKSLQDATVNHTEETLNQHSNTIEGAHAMVLNELTQAYQQLSLADAAGAQGYNTLLKQKTLDSVDKVLALNTLVGQKLGGLMQTNTSLSSNVQPEDSRSVSTGSRTGVGD